MENVIQHSSILFEKKLSKYSLKAVFHLLLGEQRDTGDGLTYFCSSASCNMLPLSSAEVLHEGADEEGWEEGYTERKVTQNWSLF